MYYGIAKHSQDHDWFDPDTSNKINDILALALLRSQMKRVVTRGANHFKSF